MGSEKTFDWENIKTIYHYEDTGRGKWGYEIRIGQWRVDGHLGDVCLEKRAFEKGDSGFIKWGKAQGFTKADAYRIIDNAQAIAEIMRFSMPKDFNSKPKQQELINQEY